MEAHGGKYCWEIKVQLMGRPGKEGNRLAVELMNLPLTPEEFHLEKQTHKDKLFPFAEALPGMALSFSYYLALTTQKFVLLGICNQDIA